MTRPRHPVAYIRRSTADAGNPGDVSRAVQENAIRELAQRDGFNGDVRYFVDWARSADEEKTSRRTEYARLLAEIEAGRVTDLYSYALDRLNRSVVMTGKLMRACIDKGVRIVTAREGEVNESNPSDWLRVTTLAMVSEYDLRVMKTRAQHNVARRRERGDYLGVAPYGSRLEKGKLTDAPDESVEAVVDAYKRAGSFLGAAKLLTAEGKVKPRNGDHWSEQTVQRIVRRVMHVGKIEQGVKQRAEWILFRLLKCPHCGTTLTAQHRKNPIYFCNTARRDPRHPRPYAVAESKLFGWVKQEASRFRPPPSVELAADDHDRHQIEGRLERAVTRFLDGGLTEEGYQAEKERARRDLDALDTVAEVVTVPRINWDEWSRAAINAILRTYWEFIELDADMKPVRAEWRLPAEYIAGRTSRRRDVST